MSLFEHIDVIVEVPYQSNMKYEMDNGRLRLDRVLSCSMFYPGNYGYIENTLADDGDPLDAIIITDYKIVPGTIVKCKVIGALIMTDEKGLDEKIIVVPDNDVDIRYNEINNIADLGVVRLSKIKHFFENYKKIDQGKWSTVDNFIDTPKAIEIIHRYRKKYLTNSE